MANSEVMIKSKYHNHFSPVENPSQSLITEQGAEITPLELLRRLVAGEPLGSNVYEDYDDDPNEMDPLNTPGIEIENYGIIQDVIAHVKDKTAAAHAEQRTKTEQAKDSDKDVHKEVERSETT